MTTKQLGKLVAMRTAANEVMRTRRLPLGQLDEGRRQYIENTCALFRDTDMAIVEELRKHDRPVQVKVKGKPVLLWLLHHRDMFAECDPNTGDLIYASAAAADQKHYKTLLYRYPSATRAS